MKELIKMNQQPQFLLAKLFLVFRPVLLSKKVEIQLYSQFWILLFNYCQGALVLKQKNAFLASQKSRWRRSGETGAGFLALHSQSLPVFTDRIYSELLASTGTVLWDRFVDSAACHLKVCPNTCCSVTTSRSTLCNLLKYSTPGFPTLHHLPEFAQTHVHWVGDASNHLTLCRPLLLLSSIFPSLRVFSNESALRIRWPKCWSFSFSGRGAYSPKSRSWLDSNTDSRDMDLSKLLETVEDRGAWCAAVRGVTKGRMQLTNSTAILKEAWWGWGCIKVGWLDF